MPNTLYDGSGNQIDVGGGGGAYTDPITVTVGTRGDYATLNAALTAVTEKYPVYRQGQTVSGKPSTANDVIIKILSGTTINEQISVLKADYSYVTITAEDSYVPVNVDGFTARGLDTHDLRSPNVGALIGGENGAGLPCVGCLFKVAQNTSDIKVVGYFANRSSKGVVLSGCGFDGFNDGVISNNESTVTIREGIARNMTRWGVHARHNGEVSARSADLTNCGAIGAYADRVANLDAREADCSGCVKAIDAQNASQICAAGTHCTNGGTGTTSGSLIGSQSGSIVDCNGMEIVAPYCKEVFGVNQGGIITAFGLINYRNVHQIDFCNLQNTSQLYNYGIVWASNKYPSHVITVNATPADATITLKKSNNTFVPDEGTNNVFTMVDDTYTLSVSATGYVTHTESITLSGADQTVNVTLEAE